MFVVKRVLDGGFGEGHSQMVVLSQVVVVEDDKSLNGFFHRTQLDQRHLAVLPVNHTWIVKIRYWVIMKQAKVPHRKSSFSISWPNRNKVNDIKRGKIYRKNL